MEQEDLLEEIHALVKDNHRMLRSVRRSQLLSSVGTIVIWIIVLALPIYLYQQYLAPTVAKISSVTGVSTSTTSSLFGIPTSNEVGKLLNSNKTGQ
jgi:hypothetical protein